MECKVKIENRIVELLDRNISFEIIYKTLKEENYKEAKRLTRLISVIEDRILAIYGYEKMKQYFINMLVEKYNNEYEWVNLDGEAVKMGKELNISIDTESLKIICPNGKEK
jgi:hypothetical protein